MFNVELKKEALRIHEETLARYNNSYEKMKNECENLYNVRGQAFLALAGPIGWGITAVSTGASLISLSNKNKELADKAVNEAKEISIARESLDEVSEKVNSLRAKTDILYTDMDKQRAKILKFLNADYLSLEDEDKYFLGTLVNNTLSLSVLLNETVQ